MRKFLEKMGKDKFRNNSTVFFIIADFWTFFYIYKKFTNKDFMNRIIDIAAKQQPIDKSHLGDFYSLMTQSLILLLGLAAIVHIINYVLYNKNKKAAFAYLNLYAWSASIGFPIWAYSILETSKPAALIFAVLGGLMFFNALGLRTFPHIETKKN